MMFASTKKSMLYAKIVESLKKKTKFSKQELEYLCKMYDKLTCSATDEKTTSSEIRSSHHISEGIDRTVFRKAMHNIFDIITDETLTERLFCCWAREHEGSIRLIPWILGLDIFLRGSQKDKIDFCFRVYDLNNDGYITKDEIFQLYKNCVVKQPGEEDPDEAVRDLTEIVLKKFDLDHDSKLSFQDYQTTVKNNSLLLEAFGQCLPTEERRLAFLATLETL